MAFLLQPWQFYFIIIAGWVNRQQQELIEYLRTENQVLKEKLGKKRILLNNDQRRRLAVKGKILGRKRLKEIGTLFTPDTILRWHSMLVAKKWDYSERRKSVGRPRVRKVIVDLVLRVARENPTWGYDRIQGALANLGHKISDQTVGNILKEHGIEPAPERKRQTLLEDLPQSPLGRPGCDRLHDNRGLDERWAGHVLSALRHGCRHASSSLGCLHTDTWRRLHETSCSESD